MSLQVGPDFLCIGMQKAGTGWLYDQLQHHPDFWMPPIKELRYLNRAEPGMGQARELLNMAYNAPKRLQKELARAEKRPWDERDFEFLRLACATGEQPRDLERYAALFRSKGDRLSGDITPAYSSLEEEFVSNIAGRFPDLKVILLLRDPVSRAWSQISMGHRRGRFDGALLEDPEAFRTYLKSASNIAQRGYPTQIAALWTHSVPALTFRHFFFDEIEKEPEKARAKILTFLGADFEKKSGELAPDHNRKSSYQKLELTDGIKAVLVEHFADEIRASVDLFGEYACDWAARYGL